MANTASATGRIELAHDHDWFRVQLTAGTVYLFALEGTASATGFTLGTFTDVPTLSLLGSTGEVIQIAGITYSVSSYSDPLMSFRPDTTGTYYLDVGAAGERETGTYRISASQGYVDDFTANIATTGVLDWLDGTPDTTAPTVSSFSPADEATHVGVASNIVLTFSEDIQRGSGNIVLKTAAGATVETYNAASSGNLSIAGATLTLNPTADLLFNTGYRVEFAAGTIKDLAGNSYAGTTSYNFTTVLAFVGNLGNDILIGADDNEWIDGLNGNDTLYGGRGDDTFIGGAGNDYLRGDATFLSGGSTIEVGSGADLLRGVMETTR